MRLIMLPTLAAHRLCRMRPDGRRAHEALAARLLFLVRPRHLAGLAANTEAAAAQRLRDIVVVPTAQVPTIGAAALAGLRTPSSASRHERRRGRTALTIVQLADRPMFRARELRLREGQRLELR